ncbi:MAG: Ig-like domain-containing protein, partial [Actinomycetota bacterium]|nr:Ig-like domain-containing protein [Actinomycetota bacterium]
ASPVDGSTYQTLPANINGTATTGSTVYIYIDGVFVTTASAAAGTWTFATPALTQGQHTVMVFSDVNGSQSDQSSAAFTFDNVAPVAPVITTPAAATTYTPDTTPTVGGTAEANSTVNVYRAGNVLIGTTTADGSGNWTLDTSALAEGSHTITARATDAAGNQGVASASKTIVIDTTAPSVSLTAPANGSATNDSTPPVTFSLTETNQGTSRCIINGVLPGTVCASGGSLATLADGSYTLTIQHTDLAGNIGTSATHVFTVDTTAPVAPSVNSPASPFTTNDQTPAFAGLAEPNNNVYIYVDGILNSVTFSDGSGNWSMDLGTVAVGVHSVYVTSMDAAGNTSPQSAPSRSLTIDTTAPAVSVTSPASDGLTVGPTGNITFTATDAVGPVTSTCQMDATPAVACTSPFAYGPLSGGGHTFTVTATDGANNSTVAIRTFIVDATPPNTTITGNPASITNATAANFTFTSTESPSTFECQLDANPLASCTSPDAYAGLTEGSHTFFVRATDQYGNVDASPASYTWTIDTTAPIAPTISTPGSDIVTSDTTPAVGGLAEPGSTVRVYEGVTLIGTAIADGGGNWALSPGPTLAVGSHALIARATDPAGNVSSDSGPRTIVVDTISPTVTLSAPANGSTTNSATPAITFSVGDANPSPASTCTIDGGTPVVCTTGYTPPALGDGTHTVVVSHTDLAGNIGTSATHTFTVDTAAPGAPTITSGPSAPVASTSAAFGFTGEPGATYECYIDSPVAWVSCTSPETYNSLDQGVHTFHVRQIDAGGNVGPESTRSWSVDTVGPPAPSVSGPSGTVGSTSATIDFNDTESPVTYMCSLNGAAATLCTSPVNLTGLADGPHTYEVYAVDVLGNAGSPASIGWTVDSSLFTAGITDGPLGTVATSANSLSFTATIVAGTTFMCR